MTVASLVLSGLALLLAAWLTVQVVGIKRRIAAVPADGDVFKALRELDADLAVNESTVADLAPRLAALEDRMPHALTHTGVIAYDAFDNIAGNQSKSIALLDDRGSGIVLSMLVGRSETLVFSKQLHEGKPNEPLSPEEQRAVKIALAR